MGATASQTEFLPGANVGSVEVARTLFKDADRRGGNIGNRLGSRSCGG